MLIDFSVCMVLCGRNCAEMNTIYLFRIGLKFGSSQRSPPHDFLRGWCCDLKAMLALLGPNGKLHTTCYRNRVLFLTSMRFLTPLQRTSGVHFFHRHITVFVF
jgi:hypothetical protein